MKAKAMSCRLIDYLILCLFVLHPSPLRHLT